MLIECVAHPAINRLYVQTYNLVLYAGVPKKIPVNELEQLVYYVFLFLSRISLLHHRCLPYEIDKTFAIVGDPNTFRCTVYSPHDQNGPVQDPTYIQCLFNVI